MAPTIIRAPLVSPSFGCIKLRFFLCRLFACTSNDYDMVVVGGGILGAASARELLIRHPRMKIALLEKECKLAAHQSGHNSGVIHAGIYYKPGSQKAELCVKGSCMLYEYCEKKKIPFKKSGKLIIATNEKEVCRLADLFKRGTKNGVTDLRIICDSEIRQLEPYSNGIKALYSPHTGMVDFTLVTENYCYDFERKGGNIYLNYKVVKFGESKGDGACEYPVTIHGLKANQKLRTRYVLTCCGLQSDYMADLTGCQSSPRIVPFRCEYLVLKRRKQALLCGHICRLPHPQFPFPGVHLMRRINGDILIGPYVLIALKREGYKWSDINVKELCDTLLYPGFIKFGGKHFMYGVKESIKSVKKSQQVKELKPIVPTLSVKDVCRGPAAVYAQALCPDGHLIEHFLLDIGSKQNSIASRIMHLRNAPYPGATSSLAIAELIVCNLDQEFRLNQQYH